MDIQGQVGDSLRIRARVSDVVNGVATPRALGGAVLRSMIRHGDLFQSNEAPDNFRVSVDNAVEGIVLVSLPRTHLLPAGRYGYEVDLAMGTSNETILRGTLTIKPTLIT